MARNLWLVVVLITIAGASSAIAQSTDDSPGAKWSPWLELGGFYGSNDSSRGEAVLWIPLAQGNTTLLFGEMRGKLFEDDMREGNFALGYRRMMPGGWNLGAWGGYDIRESEYGTTFHQLAGGIEALSDRWDFRANAYLPLDDTKTPFSISTTRGTGIANLTGNQIGMVTTTTSTTTTTHELALWGIDTEIGTKLFSTPVDLPGPRHELRVYAGAYHFDHSDLPDSVTGPRLRAEWRMDEIIDAWEGSRLTFEGEYSHDDLRDDRFEVGARLRLPFGETGQSAHVSRALTAQERRMADGLERDTDIVTDTRTTAKSTTSTITEAVEDARTGVHFDKVVTVVATDDLSTESAAAGSNTLIIADGSAGNFGGASNDDLQGNQTLVGGGSTIEVRGQNTGVVTSFTASGVAPALFSYGVSTKLNVTGSNTHVTGLTFDGNSSSTLLIDIRPNAQNVLISNSILRNGAFAYYAIFAEPGSSFTVDGVDIYNINRAIQLHDATATITNTNIDADYLGLAVSGAGSSLEISNSTISGTLSHAGISIGSGPTVTGTGNTGGPNFTCSGSSTAWAGSFEFSGVTYSYATNCN